MEIFNPELDDKIRDAGEIYDNMGIQLYPNPAKKMLNIKLNESINNRISIQIFDFLGRQVYQPYLKEKSCQISIEDLDSGVYFILMKSPDGVKKTEKFIKL